MPNGYGVEPPYHIIDYYIDGVSTGVADVVQGSVVDTIIDGLDTLGLDVETSEARIVSILNVLTATGEWDSDHAVALIDALADGAVSEAEIDGILMGVTLDESVAEVVETAADGAWNAAGHAEAAVSDGLLAARDMMIAALEELITELVVKIGDLEAKVIELDHVHGFGILSPLFPILDLVVGAVAERMEGWFANAFDIEQR